MFFLYVEIGVGLAGFGIAFLFLGVLFLFDKGLLAIGNVRWLAVSCLLFMYWKNEWFLLTIQLFCEIYKVIKNYMSFIQEVLSTIKMYGRMSTWL